MTHKKNKGLRFFEKILCYFILPAVTCCGLAGLLLVVLFGVGLITKYKRQYDPPPMYPHEYTFWNGGDMVQVGHHVYKYKKVDNEYWILTTEGKKIVLTSVSSFEKK